VGVACSAQWRVKKCIQVFCSVKLKEEDNLDELGVGKMMLKCM